MRKLDDTYAFLVVTAIFVVAAAVVPLPLLPVVVIAFLIFCFCALWELDK